MQQLFTDSNLSKETLTSDEYLTEKMARAIRAALLNDKPNGTVILIMTQLGQVVVMLL